MSRVAVLSAIFGAAFGIQTSFAADLFIDTPEPEYLPPALWTGFYIGGHIGGAWGDVDVGDTYAYNSPDPFKASAFDSSGVLGGVQIGYNIQQGDIVYGIEADLGYMSLSGKGSAHLPPENRSPRDDLYGSYSMSGGLYGDLTARLGYAADQTLFYLKGGAAFLNADFSADYKGDNCTTVGWCGNGANPSYFDFDHSETLLGWTLGFGVEYAFSPALSLKVEYQHFDFGSASFGHNGEDKFHPNLGPSVLTGSVEMEPTVDTVKFGVNYKLDQIGVR